MNQSNSNISWQLHQLASEQKETGHHVDAIKKLQEKIEASDKILAETKEEVFLTHCVSCLPVSRTL